MKKVRPALYSSLALSVLSLAVAYLFAGYWLSLLAIACMALFGYLFRKSAYFGVATALLLVHLFLCAFGLLRGLPFLPLLLASASSLAAWDLFLFSREAQMNTVRDPAVMQRDHLYYLGAVCGLGLLLAALSSMIHFKIPFGILLGFAFLAVGGIIWGLRRLRNQA